MAIMLRHASKEDSEFLLNCRNDIQSRAASLDINEITIEKHCLWLDKLLSNPNRNLFIAVHNGISVGSARADKFECRTELSWAVASFARGAGLGREIVKELSTIITGPIYAKIKKENLASIRIAKSIGMVLEAEVNGILHFSR